MSEDHPPRPQVASETIERLKRIYNLYITDVVKPTVQEEYQRRKDYRRGEWTDRTLRFFYDLGVKRKHRVFTNRRTFKLADEKLFVRIKKAYGEPPKEFLVDLCWFDSSVQQRLFPKMGMAVEVEWDPWADPESICLPVAVDEDLMKLFYLRAALKIAILGCTKSGKVLLQWQDTETLARLVEKYLTDQAKGESILLVFLANSDWDVDAGVKGYITGDRTFLELLRYSYVGFKMQ